MPAADMVERLRAARAEVDRACALLVSPSPEVLDRCSRTLETAGSRLAECRPLLREGTGNPAALQEARRLQAAVRHAGRLLEGAASFHLHWSRWLGAMCAGYTQGGHAAPAPHGNRVSIRV